MEYSFRIHGHENILSTHNRTIEFTKDTELTRNGDCIVGVKADFSLGELKKFLQLQRIKIVIAVDNISDIVTAIPNVKFNSDHELVIRMGDFDSGRTFAIRADKAASHLGSKLVSLLKAGKSGKVSISALIS